MEDTFRHNDAMREEERVHMDKISEEELVRIEQNTILVFSESFFPQMTR